MSFKYCKGWCQPRCEVLLSLNQQHKDRFYFLQGVDLLINYFRERLNIPAGALTSPWRQTYAHEVREEDTDEPSGVVFSVSLDSCGQSELPPPTPCIKAQKQIYIWHSTKEELHLRMTASYSGDVHSHTFMYFTGIFIRSDGGFKGDWSKLSHLYATEYLYSFGHVFTM